jgi:hypothetical protein
MTALHRIPGSQLTGFALSAAAHVRVRQWKERAVSPEAAQRRVLAALLEQSARTTFGRMHHLRDVRTYEELRQAVPVREYTAFLPWLTRMRGGERDLLWPGLVPFFATSGGTTAGPGGMKYLPVSNEQLRWQTRAAFDAVAQYLVLSQDRSLTGGYSLGLVPPVVVRREGAVGVSSNPALLMQHAPAMSRAFSLPRQPVAGIEDFEERLSAIADAYVDHDVRLLAGTPCWLPVFFEKLRDAARKRRRAAATVRQIWPNLRGLITGGSNPEPYRAALEAELGSDVVMLDHYNSTEAGLVACADARAGDDMLMVPDRGVFYEFVRREEHDLPNARRVPLWEVEAGVDYAVVLSTPSGLLAYSLGDVVRFTSCFPHRVKIVGRLRGGLSPAHEVTSESMIEAAVLAASARTGAATVEFTSTADDPGEAGGKTRYRFFIEFARAPRSLDAFREALDVELMKQNKLYAIYRANDVVLQAPEVVVLPVNGGARFMQALGPRSVQQKFPRTIDRARRLVLEQSFAT